MSCLDHLVRAKPAFASPLFQRRHLLRYFGAAAGAPPLFTPPGVVVPLLGEVLPGLVLPGDVEDPGAGVEYGGVADGTTGTVGDGIDEGGVTLSFVVPGAGVVVGVCSGSVPGAIVPGVPAFGAALPPLPVLPGTVVPAGLEGVVAAGGRAVELAAVELFAPVCAAQVRTSAALHAPAKIIVGTNFMMGSLFAAPTRGSILSIGSYPKAKIARASKNG